VLQEADRLGVRAIVFPELCIAPEHVARIGSAVAPLSGVAVVVAGSCHVEQSEAGGTRKCNRTEVYVRGRVAFVHDKFNPYWHEADGGRSTEDIAPSPSHITILHSGRWSMTAMICKDFLSEPVLRVLTDLLVRLVLVPACSDRLDDFIGPAQRVSERAQAVVAIANIPGAKESEAEDEKQLALVALPLRRATDRIKVQARRPGIVPGLAWRVLGNADLRVKGVGK
jgi:predicted amidohydrolase